MHDPGRERPIRHLSDLLLTGIDNAIRKLLIDREVVITQTVENITEEIIIKKQKPESWMGVHYHPENITGLYVDSERKDYDVFRELQKC